MVVRVTASVIITSEGIHINVLGAKQSVNRLYSNNCASVAELQLTDGIVYHALSFGGTLFISASQL